MADWKPYAKTREAKEWRKVDGGLTLRVWQSEFDVCRDNFQPNVMIGRALDVQGKPDAPSLKSAQREAERMAAAIRKAVSR